MITATIFEAKTNLSDLVKKAKREKPWSSPPDAAKLQSPA